MAMMLATLTALQLLGKLGSAAANTGSGCTFHAGRDYADPAVPGTEHGVNATSSEACCALCLENPVQIRSITFSTSFPERIAPPKPP